MNFIAKVAIGILVVGGFWHNRYTSKLIKVVTHNPNREGDNMHYIRKQKHVDSGFVIWQYVQHRNGKRLLCHVLKPFDNLENV
jgi:hypothetical protein